MGKRKEKIGLAAGIIGIYVLLAVVFSPVFYLNDDVAIRGIVSGAYTDTPDGHAVYMGYPLTGILALFYRIAGDVPWFTLLFAGSMLYSIYAIATEGAKNSLLRAIALTVFGFVLQFDNLLYTHYTIVAAVLAGTAVFLWVFREQKIGSIFLFVLSYLLRSQVFFLSIPFLLVAMLYRLLKEKEVRKQLVACGGLALLVGVCMLCTKFMYASEEWQRFQSFNDARTQLYDYTGFASYPIDWDGSRFGLSDSTYKVMVSYDTILDGSLNEDTMNRALSYVDEGKAGWKELLNGYFTFLKYERMPIRFCVLALYFFVFVTVCIKRDWKLCLAAGSLAVGRNAIWLFLMWQGRFPERIIISLYMLEGLLLLGLLLRESHTLKKTILRWGYAAGALAVLLLTFLGSRYTLGRLNRQHDLQKEWKLLKEYCEKNPQGLYLLDVYSVVSYGELQYEKDPKNMMLLGGWMTQSPLAEEKLGNFQATDAAEALLSENVFLIVDAQRETDWMEVYLQERFGTVSLEKTEELALSEEKVVEIFALR